MDGSPGTLLHRELIPRSVPDDEVPYGKGRHIYYIVAPAEADIRTPLVGKSRDRCGPCRISHSKENGIPPGIKQDRYTHPIKFLKYGFVQFGTDKTVVPLIIQHENRTSVTLPVIK